MSVIDPRDLFRELDRAGVIYVLIGGLAVAAHGHIRATRDLDICPDPEQDNLARLAELLVALEATNVDAKEFAAEELLEPDLAGLSAAGNFRLMTRLGALDVMQYLEPFEDASWETLSMRAEDRSVFGIQVKVCTYEDLLAMKAEAGREQDLLDIENLKAANREA